MYKLVGTETFVCCVLTDASPATSNVTEGLYTQVAPKSVAVLHFSSMRTLC